MRQYNNDGIKKGITGLVKKVALNTGESAIGGRICIGLLYEPEIPRELILENINEKKYKS